MAALEPDRVCVGTDGALASGTADFVTLDIAGCTAEHADADGSLVPDDRCRQRWQALRRLAAGAEPTCACLAAGAAWAALGDANGHVVVQELAPSRCIVGKRGGAHQAPITVRVRPQR